MQNAKQINQLKKSTQPLTSYQQKIKKKIQDKYKVLYQKDLKKQIKCYGSKSNQTKIQVQSICKNLSCKYYLFMCNNEQCTCLKDHSNCDIVLFNSFINTCQGLIKKIIKVLKELDDQEKENKTVYQFLKNFKDQNQKRVFDTFMEGQKLQYILENIKNCIGIQGFGQKFRKFLLSARENNSKINEEDFSSSIKQNFKKLYLNINRLIQGSKDFCKIYSTYRLSKILNGGHLKDPIQQLFNKKKNIITNVQQKLTISNLQLIYQASQNEFSISSFYQKCNGKNNTILIIKTQSDKIIGGYTPKAWESTSQGSFIKDQSESTFIFSLTMKKQDEQQEQKFSYTKKVILRQSGKSCGISNSYYSGPCFGTAQTYNLVVCSNANTQKGSCLVLNDNFVDKRKIYQKPSQQFYQEFTGSKNGMFLIKQWEIWQITF